MKKKKELYDRLKGEKKFKDENERENKYFDEIEKVVRNSKTYEEFKIKVEYVFEDLKKDYNKIIKKVIKIPENDEKDINKVKSILRDKYHIFIYWLYERINYYKPEWRSKVKFKNKIPKLNVRFTTVETFSKEKINKLKKQEELLRQYKNEGYIFRTLIFNDKNNIHNRERLIKEFQEVFKDKKHLFKFISNSVEHQVNGFLKSEKELIKAFYTLKQERVSIYEDLLNELKNKKNLKEVKKVLEIKIKQERESKIKAIDESLDFVKKYEKKISSTQKYSNKVHRKFYNLKKTLLIEEAVIKLKELFPEDIEVQNIKNSENFNRTNNDYINRHKDLI